MRKRLLLISAVILTLASYGQLTGSYSIPGAPYATVAAAVTALNTQGVGPGGVTFNIAADYTEPVTAPLLLTATGTSDNPILFQKSGTGANPKITRTDAGTVVTTVLGGQGDAVIIIQGSDYVTFDRLDVATNDAGIEYGYYLRKASATDGCKFVTIKNSAITLTKGTSAFVTGIYSSNNDATSLVSAATGITVTSTGGRNENITLTGNTIGNVFCGIILRGFNHNTAPYDFQDQNNVIGTGGAGNVIQNYAGNTAATAYGIYMIYQTSPSVGFNTIDNAGGGGTNALSTLYGLMMTTSNAGGDFSVINNAITIGTAGTSGVHCIYVSPPCTSITIRGNTFSFGSFTSTSTSYLINCATNTNNVTIDGNSTLGAITKTGAGTFYGFYNLGGPTGGTAVISNNNFSNITLTGASTFYGIDQYSTAQQAVVITNNTVTNITGGTNTMYGIYEGYGVAGSTVNGNLVSGISNTGTTAVYGLYLGVSAPVSLSVYNNTICNLSASGVNTVYGIYNANGADNRIYKNRIYNLTGNNAGSTVYGIFVNNGVQTSIYNNFISDLKAPVATGSNAVVGISLTGGTTINCAYNTIFLNAVSTSVTTFGTTGIYTGTTPVIDLRNNNVVNLSTPVGSSLTVAHRRSGAATTNLTATTGTNNYFAGTAPNNMIYSDGVVTYATVPAYKAALSPKEAGTVGENPPFINVATTPYDLHIGTTVPTLLESSGSAIATITDDFDGNPRSSTPDIGADEFAGIGAGVINPGAFTAQPFNSVQINLTYVPNPSGNNVLIVWNLTGSFTAPSGPPPAVGSTFAGGTVLSYGTTSPVTHPGLTFGTPYYYKAFSYDGSAYSDGSAATATPLVVPPTGLTATPVSPTEIDLAWIPNASGHNVVVATSPTSTFGTPVNGTALSVNDPIAGGGTVIYVGPLTAFNHTGLGLASIHYYKAWSVDEFQYYSATGATASATSQCPSAFPPPFAQNFEGAAFPPACWTRAVGQLLPTVTLTGTSSTWALDDYRNVTSPVDKAAKVNLYYTGVYSWLFTPTIDLGATPSAYQMEFDLSFNTYNTTNPPGTSGVDDKFAVVVSTDGGATWSSTNIIRLWDNAGSSYVLNNISYLGEHVVIPLTGLSGIVKFGFYGETTVSNADNDLMINNLVIQEPPLCVAPATLTVSSINTNDARIGWTGAATVQIEYGSAGHSAGTGTIIPNVTANPYLLEGLTSNTTYDVYVRQDCGAGLFSSWYGPVQFTTSCDGANAFTQNFDGVTAPAFPSCWNKVGNGGSAYTEPTVSQSSPNGLYMYTGSSVAPFAVVAMPPLKNAGGGMNWLRFSARGNSTVGGTIEVGYLTDPLDASTFNALQTFVINSLTFSEYIAVPGTAPGSASRLAFRHIGTASVIIDDVNWEPIPTCPAPAYLSASSVTVNSALLGWSEMGSATAWEYVYGTSPVPAPMGSGIPASSNPVQVSGLTPNTTYQFYVRSNCGTEYSTWSGPFTFTTLCGPSDVPYTQNFDGVTAPAIPSCLTVSDGNSDGVQWMTSTANAPRSLPNSMRISYNASLAMNDWFFTPPLTMAPGTYSVKFWYKNYGTTYPEKMEVKWGNAPTAAGMTNGPIFDNSNIVSATFVEGTGTITVTVGGDYFVGWHGYSDMNKYYLMVDDISITPVLPLGVGGTVTNVTCYGGANGAITTTVTGGTAPYTYAWSNATTQSSVNGLEAGTYSVTVTDATLATVTGSWTINQPSTLSLTAQATPAFCATVGDGSIDLSVSGGTPAYAYLWSNGATVADLSGLLPGTYAVTVTDANLCLKTGNWTVGQTNPICDVNLTLTGTVLPNSSECHNALNTIVVAGIAPYLVSAPNGRVELIAGISILFEPGVTVESGAYLFAHIYEGTWCVNPTAPIVSSGKGEEAERNLSVGNFILYPNPTGGKFTILQKADGTFRTVGVEIYSLNGIRVLEERMTGEKTREFSITSLPSGIYFVRLVADGSVETVKLVKTR